MTILQIIIIISLTPFIMVLTYRFFSNGKLYFTSYYNGKKEITSNEESIKIQILRTLKKSNFKRIKEDNGIFYAITIPTIWSFSEIIKVEILKNSENKFLVKFDSKCLFPLQIFDWGKNKKNFSVFFKNLES